MSLLCTRSSQIASPITVTHQDCIGSTKKINYLNTSTHIIDIASSLATGRNKRTTLAWGDCLTATPESDRLEMIVEQFLVVNTPVVRVRRSVWEKEHIRAKE
ncbi:hypothetical protein BgiMline_023689 [Biomphalaria glabrata]|nr:hypothetical protein BgiMline_006931 [Biomphalaria glabrata]